MKNHKNPIRKAHASTQTLPKQALAQVRGGDGIIGGGLTVDTNSIIDTDGIIGGGR